MDADIGQELRGESCDGHADSTHVNMKASGPIANPSDFGEIEENEIQTSGTSKP